MYILVSINNTDNKDNKDNNNITIINVIKDKLPPRNRMVVLYCYYLTFF